MFEDNLACLRDEWPQGSTAERNTSLFDRTTDGRSMRRRQVLAAAGAATALPLAGCTALRGPVDLGHPDETEDGERERHFVWSRDGTDQATFSVIQRTVPDSPADQFRLRLHVSHRPGLSIDRMRYRLQAPTDPTAVQAYVYVQAPSGGPWPGFTLTRDRWTTVAVDDIGELGEGSLGVNLLVRPVPGEPVEDVRLDAELGLSESGTLSREYRAATLATFPIDNGG